jgi:FAD-linked oxidoreductase
MISRRSLLNNLITAAAGIMVAPNLVFANTNKENRIPWKNWSGSQVCYPEFRKAPATVEELQALIVNAKGRVRPVGAGHSFMPLVPTDDTIISISKLTGVIDHDAEKNQATILAGTRLGDIGAPLAQRGQALLNMPDIDEQTLAGALGTATHGTGQDIGCMSSFVEELQLIAANGEKIDCSRTKNKEIFDAARVNLGALGVVTQIKMQNRPKYRLKRETTWLPIEEILANVDELANNNRNLEFYYIPFTGMGFIDAQNITDEPISVSHKLDQNDGAEDLKLARDMLQWSPKLRELVLGTYMKTISKEVTIANSWQNYASERNVRFNEMEYHLPRENMVKAFTEIKDLVEKNFPEVFFPFEVRYIKSDDIWLSPFYQRETCSIAVHRFYQEDYKTMFKAVEPILQKYQGRPHWGKINTMTASQLKPHYAKWNDFNEVRRQLDPQDKFVNHYLQTLFS